MNAKILTDGSKFGRYTIRGNPIKKEGLPYFYECQCECGRVKIVNGAKLRRGTTKSCGCFKRDATIKRETIHGMSKHPLFRVRLSLIHRCTNNKNSHWSNYGGRGITVCSEWNNSPEAFFNWALNNGYAKGLQIDRINNDGPYSPENCRWVNGSKNCRNTRKNITFEYKDQIKCLKEWCDIYNVNYKLSHARIQRGWSFEEAMFKGKMKSRFG